MNRQRLLLLHGAESREEAERFLEAVLPKTVAQGRSEGGGLLAEGTPAQLRENKNSITGSYL